MTISMLYKQKLWIVEASVESAAAERLAGPLNHNALALTIMAPPRQQLARIEAIYDHEPDLADLTARIAVVAMLSGLPAPKLTCRQAPPLDWLKKVAEDFPPFKVGSWTIHGAHHRDKVPDRRMALQIDATNAFGTGEHPTTRGCLQFLDHELKRRPHLTKMLDIGCGSGILAMAFAKATHGIVVATDLDPVSVMIARYNRDANGLRANIRTGLSFGYRAAMVGKHAPYDLIMSNIFARPLALMAKDLKRHLRPGGIAILAGLLNHQANQVISAHRTQGLKLIKKRRSGEWTILALKRDDRA